jgi:hypothetical protein
MPVQSHKTASEARADLQWSQSLREVSIPECKSGTVAAYSLPWPIPSEGFKIEVARWFYEPTQRRNGGEWIYFIRCGLLDGQITPGKAVLSLNAWRVRQDYVKKHCFGLEFVCAGPDAEVSLKVRRLPLNVAREVHGFIAAIREKSDKDQARYERAMGSTAW